MCCRFEVEALCKAPSNVRGRQPCIALRGPDAAAELQMIAAFKNLSPEALPLLPALLVSPLSAPQRPAFTAQPQLQQPAAASAAGQTPSQGQASASGIFGASPRHSQPSGQVRPSGEVSACKGASSQGGLESSQGVPNPERLSKQGGSPTQPESSSKQPKRTPASEIIEMEETEGIDGDGAPMEDTQMSTEQSSSPEAPPTGIVDADSVIQRFGLNAEQAAALRAMGAWAKPGASAVRPILLLRMDC